jgi:hypothetical protein
MKKEIYEPPKQSGAGQIFDAIFIMILIYVVLLSPIVLGLTTGKTVTNLPETITWESLGQNEKMVASWEKLGVPIEEAAEMISTRFDYSINPIALILTAIVIIGYYVLLLKMSDREYKDVIHEKFEIADKE